MRFTPGSQLATILLCACVCVCVYLCDSTRAVATCPAIFQRVVSLVAYFFGPVYGLIDKLQRCNYFS